MCGLIGIASSGSFGFSKDEMDSLVEMLIINQFRGVDSTGIVGITNEGGYQWTKEVGPPNNLLSTKNWGEIRKDIYSKGRLAFGHGRWATKGNITTDNAHPFMITREDKSDVILIHNGTLWEHQTLPGFTEHDVDSEWLAQKIADLGPEEALAKVNGAIATMWFDTRDNTFNVFRNHERPLFFVQDKGGTFFFNSEKAPLVYIQEKHNLRFNPSDIRSLQERHLFTFKMTSKLINPNFSKKEIVKYWPKHNPPVHVYNHPTTANDGGTTNFTGSLHDDVEMVDLLVDGTIKQIVFGKSATSHSPVVIVQYTSGTRSQVVGAPWEPGLIRVHYNEDTDKIIRTYERFVTKDNNTKTEYPQIDADSQTLKEYLRAKKILSQERGVIPIRDAHFSRRRKATDEDKIIVPELGTTFKCGKTSKFKSRLLTGATLAHRCLVSPSSPRLFDVYSNELDGQIKRGDEVLVEVHRTESIDSSGVTYVKAWCTRLKEKQDIVIDIWFTKTDMSEEEIRQTGWFKGTISTIRLANKEVRETTGGVVEVVLNEVSAVTEADINVH